MDESLEHMNTILQLISHTELSVAQYAMIAGNLGEGSGFNEPDGVGNRAIGSLIAVFS